MELTLLKEGLLKFNKETGNTTVNINDLVNIINKIERKEFIRIQKEVEYLDDALSECTNPNN